jgi:prolyl oligopeptidase PreP (S9A serine peptidase family)
MAIGLGNKLKTASLDEVMLTRAREIWSYRINFDYVSLENKNEMNRWCEKNCRGIWRSENYFALYWQFTDEQDATMFMLRWGSAKGNKLK